MSRLSALKGSVSLVTGGASGLGKATAERFIQHGGKVVILDLPSSDGENVAKELGDNCVFAPADITIEEDVAKAVATVKSKFGSLNNLVNCAGFGFAKKAYSFGNGAPHELHTFIKLLQTNVGGMFNVICTAVPLMIESEGSTEDKTKGVIVNTSSIAAYEGQTGQSAFAAACGAVNSMTLPLARDLCSANIRVATIAAGLFETPPMLTTPKKVLDAYAFVTPLPKRLGHASEFAQMVQTIIENPMLNGEIIRLDGAMRQTP